MPGPLDDAVLGAYERAKAKAKAARTPAPTLGTFIDSQARAFEERGDAEKGRKLRDFLNRQQAAELDQRAAESASAFESAVLEGIRPMNPLRGRGGASMTPGQAAELQAAREEKAEVAGLGGRASPTTTDGARSWSSVDPARMADMLEAAGEPVEGKVAAEIHRMFVDRYGDLSLTDESAEAMAQHLWRKRATDLQAEEAQGEESRGTLGAPQDFMRVTRTGEHGPTAERARTYVRDVLAQRRARAAERATSNPLGTALRENLLGPVMEGGAAIGSLFREDPVSGADVATVLTGGGTDPLMDDEAKEILRHAMETPGLQIIRGAVHATADLLPLTMATKGATAALTALRVPQEIAVGVGRPLGMGVWSGLISGGTPQDRGIAALQGGLMISVAHNVAKAPVLQRMFSALPGRASNAVTEAIGFLAGDAVSRGMDVSLEEAVHSLVLGAFMGAQHARTPAEQRLQAARAIVREAALRSQAIVVGPDGKATLHPDLIRTPDQAAAAAMEARIRSGVGVTTDGQVAASPRGRVIREGVGSPPAPQLGPRAPLAGTTGDRRMVPPEPVQKALPEGKRPEVVTPRWQQGEQGAAMEAAARAQGDAAQRRPHSGPPEAQPAAAPAAPPAAPPEAVARPAEPPAAPEIPVARRRILRTKQHEKAVERAAEARKELRSLQAERYTDKRTGLRNTDAWEAMRSRWGKAEDGTPKPPEGLVVAVSDLGEFKALNDTAGHAAGDRALAKVGERFREVAKEAGIDERNLFRTGGDEFTVVGTRDQIIAFERALRARGPIEEAGHKVHIDTGTGVTPESADMILRGRKAERKKAAGIGTREQEAAKRERAEVETFTKDMPPMQRGAATKALDAAMSHDGKPSTRREIVESMVRDGATVQTGPKGEVRLTKPDGAFLDEGQIGKVAMRYARHLLAAKQSAAPTEAEIAARNPSEDSRFHLGHRILHEKGGGKVWIETMGGKWVADVKDREAAIEFIDRLVATERQKAKEPPAPAGQAEPPKSGIAPGQPPTPIKAPEPAGTAAERKVESLRARVQNLERDIEALPPALKGLAEKNLRELRADLRTAEKAAGVGPAGPDQSPKTEAAAQRRAIPDAGTSKGRETDVLARGGNVKARYQAVEAEHVLPSHDPTKEYAWREGYPRDLQERDYGAAKAEQLKVETMRGKLEPAEVVNTAPRATEGPPTVASGGEVINGNGRAMAILSAAPEGKARYRQYLLDHAAEFGLDRAAIEKMREPVLVRVTELDARSREAQEFGRVGNESGTQAVAPIVAAQRNVSLVSESVWDALRTNPEATVSETINDPSAFGVEFRKRLRDGLPESERPRYFHEDGTLTGAGKELAEDMVLLRALTGAKDVQGIRVAAEVLERIPASMRRTLAQSSIQLMDLRKQEGGRAQVSGLLEAADYLTTVMAGENPSKWFDSAKQGGVQPPPMSPEARAWIDWLYVNRSSPKKMREVLKALASLEEVTGREEGGMFAGAVEQTAPEMRLARVLDGWRPKEGENVVVNDSGGLLFSPEVGAYSPERLSELPASMRGVPPPDPIVGAPRSGNGFALDMPPLTAGPTADWKGKRVAAHEVIRSLEKAIRGIPIRVGRMGHHAKRAAGFFRVGPEAIRIREANDLPTAIHEASHAVEKIIYWNEARQPGFIPAMSGKVGAQLVQLGRMLYGNTRPAGGYKREGFAEFLRGWMAGSPDLKKHAPDLLRWFEGTFLKQHKRMAADLLAAKRHMAQWVAQGRENRYAAEIQKRPPSLNIHEAARLAKTRMIEAGDALAEASAEVESRRGHKLAPSEDPFAVLTGLRLTHSARVRYMIERGMIDPAGNLRGGSLGEATAIVAQAGKRNGWSRKQTIERFTLYLWGRRAVERIARKHANPGMALKDAMALVRQFASPEFELAASKVYAWNRGVLEYAVAGGALSPREAAVILGGSTDYIPLQRAVERLSSTDAANRAVQGGSPLRLFRGSGLGIKDPFAVMAENAEKMVRWTHERMVSNALVGLSNVQGMGRFIEAIPKSVVARMIPLERIRKSLEEAGADLSGADADAIIPFFTPAATTPKGKPIIAHKNRQGKTDWYEVDPKVYEAMHGLDVTRLPKWVDATFGRAARALRLGTTGLRASFSLVTNPLRDTVTGYLQSATSKNPVKHVAQQAKASAEAALALFGGKSHYADLFRRLGGEMALPMGFDMRHTQRAVKQLFSGKGWRGRAVRVLTSPIEHLRDLFQFSESASRTAELRRMAKEVNYQPGGPITLDQMLHMLIAAKRVTVDFTSAGTWARSINQVVPFFNATIQGTRSMARALKENPTATILKALATRTIPTLILWNQLKDEDWYKDMPWRERFSYWWFPAGDSELVAIPRAYEWDNVFSTLPEAILDSLHRRDPEAAKQAVGHYFASSPLQYLPWSPTDGFRWGIAGENPLLGEALEQASNRDSFTGQKIVPESQKDMAAEEQEAPYTSGIARFIGKQLKWSPRRIDHALRGITGGLTHDTADLADALGKVFTGQDPGIGMRGPERGEFKDVAVVGTALGRRGGREGVGSLAVERLYDRLAVHRERESSKARAESPDERAARLRLEDAGRAVKWLRVLQGAASTQGERQSIQREIRSIAEAALAEDGPARFQREAKDAEERGRAATSQEQPRRRILRPAR